MTNEEKNRLFAVLRATEYLFLENIALKLVQEQPAVLLVPSKSHGFVELL
jgi:hypothetical protein